MQSVLNISTLANDIRDGHPVRLVQNGRDTTSSKRFIEARPGEISTDVPARLDRLPWSRISCARACRAWRDVDSRWD